MHPCNKRPNLRKRAIKRKKNVSSDRADTITKKEIDNLKATQVTRVSPQQLVTAILRQCLAYMWAKKDSSR